LIEITKKQQSKSWAGQRRSATPFWRSLSLCEGLIRAQELDFKPSARRHSTGISHSVPFTGTRHHLDVWPALALGTSLTYAASCPDRVLARDLQQIAAPITARNFFILSKFESHRLPSPNAVPRRHASPGTRKRTRPRSERMLPLSRATSKSPCHQSIIGIRFSPRHTRQPLHEAAKCIFNRYRYL
jgi:hypothetical protein